MNIRHIRSRAIVWLRRVLRAIYARRLSSHPELRDLLDSFAQSKSAAVDMADALAIYEAVIERKPLHILELGPGTSTAVIALAIAVVQRTDPSYQPVFVAIEENPEWLAYHEDNFPADLRDKVDMIQRSSIAKTLNGERVACYDGIPAHPYDFIHIDGPNHGALGAAVSGDLIELAPYLSTDCHVIFDGRQDTSRFTAKTLPQFRIQRHPYSLNHHLVRTS